MSAPYRRVGRSSHIARRWERWGERPDPGGESRLMVAKAPWARLGRLAKCADEARLGVNQYPSHLKQGSGGIFGRPGISGAGRGHSRGIFGEESSSG